MKQNIIKEKTYDLALRIVILYKDSLRKNEFILSKQLVRSATSIGANTEEAIQAQSKADFIHKFSIAQKESFETHYWIRLLRDSGYLDIKTANELLEMCVEIQRIITAIIVKAKTNV